jgi:chemotaxis protein MotB
MTKPAQQIIVKKVKKAAHAHHGGAWKIAYADFVTAMMAFFLLMWLISMTTQEQKEGLAEYFAPGSVSPSTSGAGGLLWGTALDRSGTKPSPPREMASSTSKPEDRARRTSSGGTADSEVNRSVAGQQANHSAIASLRQTLQSMPEIADLSRNIVIEPTKEGLDVALMDEAGRSMFPEGSVQPYPSTRRVLERLAPTLRRLPNRLAITGHTASARPGPHHRARARRPRDPVGRRVPQ